MLIMLISRVRLKNWRNFQVLDIPIGERLFVVGANASGKSNFLDIFRFLRDISKTSGGGLQQALESRGGLTKIRCLAARKDPTVSIDVELKEETSEGVVLWRYLLELKQEARGYRRTLITAEKVWKKSDIILDRPNSEDSKDDMRLTQTFLEQINVNSSFRVVASFFQEVTYLHLIPQMLRYGNFFKNNVIENDPYGQSFLERIARTSEKIRHSRLKKIEEALQIAVPQLEKLEFIRDNANGHPHLEATYKHWRPNAGKQREDQFSDGTLRLIGLLWSLLETNALLLLEEPELSLNDAIVIKLPALIHRMQGRKSQVIVTTHSESLLMDKGIDAQEALLLVPASEGTVCQLAKDIEDVKTLLENGFTMAEALLPKSRPDKVGNLDLFS